MSLFEILKDLLPGVWVTLKVTLGGCFLALLLSFAAGLGKLSKFLPLKYLAISYIEVFRGTSALVQLFWFFYVLPFFGIDMPAIIAGIVVLGLNSGAYGAEIVRGAVLAVPKGQYEASRALNMTRGQCLIRVILPQATVAMLPPFGNIGIELLKNTALVSTITLADLTFEAENLRTQTMQTGEIFGLTLLLYFAIALVFTYFIRSLEKYFGRGMDIGGVK